MGRPQDTPVGPKLPSSGPAGELSLHPAPCTIFDVLVGTASPSAAKEDRGSRRASGKARENLRKERKGNFREFLAEQEVRSNASRGGAACLYVFCPVVGLG
jgi:hypothetical protein